MPLYTTQMWQVPEEEMQPPAATPTKSHKALPGHSYAYNSDFCLKKVAQLCRDMQGNVPPATEMQQHWGEKSGALSD